MNLHAVVPRMSFGIEHVSAVLLLHARSQGFRHRRQRSVMNLRRQKLADVHAFQLGRAARFVPTIRKQHVKLLIEHQQHVRQRGEHLIERVDAVGQPIDRRMSCAHIRNGQQQHLGRVRNHQRFDDCSAARGGVLPLQIHIETELGSRLIEHRCELLLLFADFSDEGCRI